MTKIKPFYYLFLLVFFSCANGPEKPVGENDTLSSGKVTIWADESFQPIIEEQLQVFLASNPKADLNVKFTDEQTIKQELLDAGGKMVISSKALSKDEISSLKAKNYSPEINRIAIDAAALIINKASTDTSITIEKLKDLLSGKSTAYNVVFDNPRSGIVQYLKELSGSDLKKKNIYALKSNVDVIRYVSEHQNTIGVIGFNWLNDPSADYKKYVEGVRLMSVKNDKEKEFFKPSQTTLALKQYPLSRGIYVINATGRLGLGTGFANFMIGERGQRILLKSELLPEQIPPREIRIRN